MIDGNDELACDGCGCNLSVDGSIFCAGCNLPDDSSERDEERKRCVLIIREQEDSGALDSKMADKLCSLILTETM